MDFFFIPYSNEQRKTFVNAELLYKGYLERSIKYFKSFNYKMGWNKKGDKKYLYKECYFTKKRQSLGVETEDNIEIFNAFNSQKKELKVSLNATKELMLRQEKINKFTKISRVPNVLVNFFRNINELGLDDKVIVIGTNSLYAYEAYSGVFIEEEHLATFDIDVFNKRDKKISIVLQEKMPQKTLKALLLDVDKTFVKSKEAQYRFSNNDGVVVEIITPISKKQLNNDTFSGVINLEINGTKWLESSKLLKQMVIAQNGKCAFISVVQPLEYAIYKNWLGKHERKDMMKQQRDIKQSRLVASLIRGHIPIIDIENDISDIKNMSKEAIAEFQQDILLSN